jgi:large subunit ribosomal protein L25
MSNPILRAEPRTVVGKKVKRLRREGLVPGVVYGPVIDGTVQVQVGHREFDKFYWANGHSTLVTLEWEGRSEQVFIHEVQIDPVKRTPVHVDFFAPNLTKALTAMVPVILHNQSSAIEGVLNQVHSEIEVRGLPSAIPHQIDGDVSALVTVGDVLRVADLNLPEGITVALDPDEALATVSPEVSAEEEEIVPPEESEEVAEAMVDSVPTSVEGGGNPAP